MSDDRALNLDELYGLSRPIKVVWRDVTYELPRPEAFTPEQLQKFEAVRKSYNKILAAEQPNLVEADALLDLALDMLEPKLKETGIPLLGKIKILEFYQDEAMGTGMETAEKKPTGP